MNETAKRAGNRAGSVPAGTVPAGTVPAGSVPAGNVPTGSVGVGTRRVGALGGLFATGGRGLPSRWRQAGRHLSQSLRLMVGVPDYGTYVAHFRQAHPEREPMSYEAFFRERQQARYGGGTGRCC